MRTLTIGNQQVTEHSGHLYLLEDDTEVRWDSIKKALVPVQRVVEVIEDYKPREHGVLTIQSGAPARAPIHHGVQKLYNHIVATYGGDNSPKEQKVRNVPDSELVTYGQTRAPHGRKGKMKKWQTVRPVQGEEVAYSTRAPRIWEGEEGSQLVIKGEDVAPKIDPEMAAIFQKYWGVS